MNDEKARLRESLSALMDDSADELELHRALTAADSEDESRDTWRRYQLARAAMHADLPERPIDLSAAISAAIAEEPEIEFGTTSSVTRFTKPLARVAIAASVTLAVVLGVQQFAGNTPLDESLPIASSLTESDGAADDSMAQPGYASSLPTPLASTRTVSGAGNPVAPLSYQPQARQQVRLLPVEPLSAEEKQEILSYINSLIQRHTEGAALGGSQGLMPYARLPQASAESDSAEE